jgi:hypothetical protein
MWESRFMKAAFGIIVMLVVIFVGVSLVPPYWANYQFEDAIKTEALISTNSVKTEDAIRDTVFKRAQDLDIPLVKDDIKVHRVGTQGTGSVSIEAPYTVPVNLPGYPVELHFTPATVNKGVL